jgi:hypothetical protein
VWLELQKAVQHRSHGVTLEREGFALVARRAVGLRCQSVQGAKNEALGIERVRRHAGAEFLGDHASSDQTQSFDARVSYPRRIFGVEHFKDSEDGAFVPSMDFDEEVIQFRGLAEADLKAQYARRTLSKHPPTR